MNAKQAKFLRRNARALAKAIGGYTVTRHRERLVKTGADCVGGTPQVRVVAPVTLHNSPDSVRGVYRTLKKLAK